MVHTAVPGGSLKGKLPVSCRLLPFGYWRKLVEVTYSVHLPLLSALTVHCTPPEQQALKVLHHKDKQLLHAAHHKSRLRHTYDIHGAYGPIHVQ